MVKIFGNHKPHNPAKDKNSKTSQSSPVSTSHSLEVPSDLPAKPSKMESHKPDSRTVLPTGRPVVPTESLSVFPFHRTTRRRVPTSSSQIKAPSQTTKMTIAGSAVSGSFSTVAFSPAFTISRNTKTPSGCVIGVKAIDPPTVVPDSTAPGELMTVKFVMTTECNPTTQKGTVVTQTRTAAATKTRTSVGSTLVTSRSALSTVSASTATATTTNTETASLFVVTGSARKATTTTTATATNTVTASTSSSASRATETTTVTTSFPTTSSPTTATTTATTTMAASLALTGLSASTASTTATATMSASPTLTPILGQHHLSRTAIALIVSASVLSLILLVVLAILMRRCLRKRQESRQGSIHNFWRGMFAPSQPVDRSIPLDNLTGGQGLPNPASFTDPYNDKDQACAAPKNLSKRKFPYDAIKGAFCSKGPSGSTAGLSDNNRFNLFFHSKANKAREAARAKAQSDANKTTDFNANDPELGLGKGNPPSEFVEVCLDEDVALEEQDKVERRKTEEKDWWDTARRSMNPFPKRS